LRWYDGRMVEHPSRSEIETAKARRADFMAALPLKLLEAEDTLPSRVRALNAATRSKIYLIYQVADDISLVREPFVACKKSCSSCCHMNVSLTKAEAERLAKAVGRKMAPIADFSRHAPDKFAGMPCPFLDTQGACSIYADRPLSCRKHSSFFETAMSCHPSVMNTIEGPQVAFSGLDEALFTASGSDGALVADIRDFFPVRS